MRPPGAAAFHERLMGAAPPDSPAPEPSVSDMPAPDTAAPDISIVVPTYREAQNIRPLVDELRAAMDEAALRWEVVVVDDASGDGIEAVCERLVARALPVRLIVRRAPRDLSAAVLEGFERARGRVLAVMDADLSHPPATVPQLFRAVEGGADLAIGSRFVTGARMAENWPLTRKLGAVVMSWAALPLAPVRDPLSGFFAISRRCLDSADDLSPFGYKILLELLVKCRAPQVAEVPIFFQNRRAGASKLGVVQGLRILRHMRALYHHRHPGASELVHFLAVGAFGLVIDILFYLFFLHAVGLHHVVAKGCSFIFAASSNWALNRRFSFIRACRAAPVSQWTRFLAVSAVGASVNVSTYWYLTANYAWFAALPLAAIVAATVLTATWNFTASKWLVFKKPRASEAVSEPD